MNAKDILLHRRNAANDGWEDVLVTVTPNGLLRIDQAENPNAGGQAPSGNFSTLSTAGAGTITAAMILTGWVQRDAAGGNRVDTTDTASAIIMAIPSLAIPGTEVSFLYQNISGGANTGTIAAGTGCTLNATATALSQNGAKRITLISTSSTTLAIAGA